MKRINRSAIGSMSGLTYPVLKLTPKFIRGGISCPKELLVVGEINFEEGCFEDAYLIDSSGCKYQVLSAKKQRWTWNPWNIFRDYRSIWVNLTLSDPEKNNIDKLREEIFDFLKVHTDWYKRYGETEESLRAKFSSARTVKELINSISVYP